MRRLLLVIFVACTPATRQWQQTLLVGPMYETDHVVWLAQLEVAVGAHEEFDGDHNSLGIQATAGGAIATDRKLTEEVVAGVDYLPFVHPQTLLGFGVQAGAAHGEIDGAMVVLPRLWFQVQAAPHWQLGVMLRGQLGSRAAATNARMTADNSAFAAGPMLVVAHIDR